MIVEKILEGCVIPSYRFTSRSNQNKNLSWLSENKCKAKGESTLPGFCVTSKPVLPLSLIKLGLVRFHSNFRDKMAEETTEEVSQNILTVGSWPRKSLISTFQTQFVVDEVSNIIKESVENTIGGNAYAHAKVSQWTNAVVESCLASLTKLQKPFKYIGEQKISLIQVWMTIWLLYFQSLVSSCRRMELDYIRRALATGTIPQTEAVQFDGKTRQCIASFQYLD